MSTDVHTLSGAYALDALAPEEADEFRRHLEGCPACRDEVRELRRAAASLGAAEAVAPPASLRPRVLGSAARTPQAPPGPRPAAATAGEPAARSRTRRWAALAAAAVLVAGGSALGVRALVDDGDGRDPGSGLAPAAVEVFEAPDARTATVETANGGRLRVGVSPGLDEMAVDTRELPDPGEGRVYQLWAVHGRDTVSAGLLTDLDAGAAMAMPAEDTAVMITVEPAGGSDAPTRDPVVEVDPRAL